MGNWTRIFANFHDDISPAMLNLFFMIANTDKLKMQHYFSV